MSRNPPRPRSLFAPDDDFGPDPDSDPGSDPSFVSVGDPAIPPAPDMTPLPERMRPRSIEEYVGQSHLLGEGRLIQRVLKGGGRLPSLILWGPPGVGKTTLARLLAAETRARFVQLSAVLAGVKELRQAVADARDARARGAPTILFIDEIHRFNKAQQDALLPAVEAGIVTLVGATTENPSFEVNAALLSRARVLTLAPLDEADVLELLRRALRDHDRGLARLRPRVSDESLGRLARAAAGDARVALAALEAAVDAAPPDPALDGQRAVTDELLAEAAGRARFAYDKDGEDHFNLVSALIKSLRNSDVDAALYWLARLLEGGADPVFVVRRLGVFASEDVGLADPDAIVQAAAAAEIVRLVGLPEGLYPLAQTVIRLAAAPKSNAVKRAYFAAAADAAETPREPVPLHLRNAVTPLMKAAGYAQGYRYVHDDPAARDEMPCLPEILRGRTYYRPDNP